MTKVTVISGFLGAGKTTLIQKLLKEAYQGEQIVLIENEFGEIGIDGGFLKDAGIAVSEMNSGCICCSLVGDFGRALKEVVTTYHPDRILIEPSGVGKLSDVEQAIARVAEDAQLELTASVAVVDANKAGVYIRNFGEFFTDQVETAKAIILSRTQNVTQDKLETCVALLREHNADAAIMTTPWEALDGKKMQEVIERAGVTLQEELLQQMKEHSHHDHEEHEHCHHDHEGHEHCHHDHEGHEHCHHDHEGHEHCHHDHEEHEHCHHDHEGHEHCHHDHEGHEHCHHDHEGHEHCHHDHEGHEHCHHDHDHHGHHHADEVFTSWGKETPAKYTKEELESVLHTLSETTECGMVLRAKGMVSAEDGTWLYFDLVPGEYEIRNGAPEYTGRLCVIGTDLNEDRLAELFHA